MSTTTLLSLPLFLLCLTCMEAFVFRYMPSRYASSRQATTSTTFVDTVASLEDAIDTKIKAGENPVPLITQLEAMENQDAQPNRSPDFLGEWYVWWTDCPPPSNGVLGPFKGTSEQMIADSSTASYQNLLRVPPNDWLMAVLDGVYEDWDGALLDDDTTFNRQNPTTTTTTKPKLGWGARHWKVTFLKLTISVFGFPLIQKDFPPNTSRVWRTTYMQDDIRIVRAGKTGRLSDEVIFYTKRRPKSL